MAVLPRAYRMPLVIAALLAPWGGLAGRAAELDVSPVTVNLSPERIRDSVTLSNNGETPTVIEARIYRWTQTATGDRSLPRTKRPSSGGYWAGGWTLWPGSGLHSMGIRLAPSRRRGYPVSESGAHDVMSDCPSRTTAGSTEQSTPRCQHSVGTVCAAAGLP